MLYYNSIDISEGIDLAWSTASKKGIICHYWFLNHGLNFKITFVRVVMIWHCCVLILLILLLSPLKEFFVVVLFMILANLKQVVW